MNNTSDLYIRLARSVQEDQLVPLRHQPHIEEPTALSYVTASLFLHEWSQRNFECKALALMIDRISSDVLEGAMQAHGLGSVEAAIEYAVTAYDLPQDQHEEAVARLTRELEAYG